MKKMTLFTALLAVFMVVLSGTALAVNENAADQAKIKAFDVLPNGKVVANGVHEFRDMGQYLRSDFFKSNGGRCLPKRGMRNGAQGMDAEVMGLPTDCDYTQTVVRPEYWPGQTYVVSVVFHVIYKKDGTGNIPDSRIINQMQALNEDYLAMAGTLGAQGFNVNVKFELVGITRTQNDKWFRENGQEYNYKTALAWDTSTYMNVYVNSAGGYLGYAYFPQDSAGEWWDGITLLYSACGGRDEGEAPYNQGRTLVHEAGHYLGLDHTFYGGCCNGYTCGDLINDTEMESEAHYDCVQVNSCGTPDPILNYMNYTDDLCMIEFTPEQANRAVCSLTNYRQGAFFVDPGTTSDVHIGDIAMSLSSQGNRTGGQAVITVKDAEGNSIPNANVSVQWSGSVSETDSALTGMDGTVTFSSSRVAGSGSTFTVTVTGVSHFTRGYDAAANVEGSDSISN